MSKQNIRGWTVFLAVVSTWFGAQLALAEQPFDLMGQGPLKSSQISPEATKQLPVQPADRGDLMPLHVASVLSWFCGDSTVQSALGKSKSACYQEIWPVVSLCTEELQTKAPAAQNRVSDKRMDVVSFRAALRKCLADQYVGQKQRQGIVVQSFAEGQPDPLAARMGSAPMK